MSESTFKSWYEGFNHRDENGHAVIDLHIVGNPVDGEATVTVKVEGHESSHTFTEQEPLMSPKFMADQAISTFVDAINRIIYDSDETAEAWVAEQLAAREASE